MKDIIADFQQGKDRRKLEREKEKRGRLIMEVLSSYHMKETSSKQTMQLLSMKSRSHLKYWYDKYLGCGGDPEVFYGLQGPGRPSPLGQEEQGLIKEQISELFGEVDARMAERFERYPEAIRLARPELTPAVVREWLRTERGWLGKELSRKQVQRLMEEEGLWQPGSRKKKPERSLRPRLPHFGSMILVDGSHHDFLITGSPCVLILGVDDATSKIVYAQMTSGETTQEYARMFKGIFDRYGIPKRIYSDKTATLYPQGRAKKLAPGALVRVMKEDYGVKMIPANSPQAKGRVERAFSTIQRYLPLHLLLKDADTLEKANQLLPDWVKRYNRRFGVKPEDSRRDFRAVKIGESPEELMFRRSYTRLGKRALFKYQGKIYQLVLPGQRGLALKGREVEIEQSLLDGQLRITVAGKVRKIRELADQTHLEVTEMDRKQVMQTK